VNVYFHTFGCKANQYDTERVREAFDANGAVVVDDPALADLAIINSCTVTNESEVKLRRLVRHVAKSGHAQTIVMGCAAALDNGVIAALPSVRAVVANAEPAVVLRAAGITGSVRVGAQHAAPLHSHARSRALLKIQDGCDEHCTFCATTLARGNNRSRPVAELIEEARSLAEQHAEIVLTGVHIGTYGQDANQGVLTPGWPPVTVPESEIETSVVVDGGALTVTARGSAGVPVFAAYSDKIASLSSWPSSMTIL